MPSDDILRFWKQPHRQVAVGRPDLNVKFSVDEGVAIAIQRLLDAGYRTLHSCQWDGPETKTFPAYINFGWDSEWELIATGKINVKLDKEMQSIVNAPLKVISNPHDVAKIIGLPKGQYQTRNGILWFKPWVD
jgi:hypothetical protein